LLKICIMKTKILLISLVLLAYLLVPGSASAQTINDPTGSWNTEAPNAPPGFNTSIMKITQDSVFTTFAGESIIYYSTSMNFKNDSLTFIIGGLDVLCILKFENETKMTGNAVWADGESPLFMTKIENQKPADSEGQ